LKLTYPLDRFRSIARRSNDLDLFMLVDDAFDLLEHDLAVVDE
jgi:hypothetical protein